MSTDDAARRGWATITPTTWQRGASVARVSGEGSLLVVADVIDPDEHTSFSARQAADVLCRSLQIPPDPERARQALQAGFRAAHRALYDPDHHSSSIFALAGAVSLASLLVAGPNVILGTIGSCRCYRQRDGELTCLDKGHSAAVRDGQAPGAPRATLTLEHRDLVTEALGLREEIRPSLGLHETRPGDRFLLCTSAVWSSIPTDLLSTAMFEASPDRGRQFLSRLVSPETGGFALAMAHVDTAAPPPEDRRG